MKFRQLFCWLEVIDLGFFRSTPSCVFWIVCNVVSIDNFFCLDVNTLIFSMILIISEFRPAFRFRSGNPFRFRCLFDTNLLQVMHVVLEAALIAPNAVGASNSLIGVLVGSAKGVLIQVNILITVGLRDPLLLGHHELLVGGRRGSTSQMVLLDCDLILAPVDGWIGIPKP